MHVNQSKIWLNYTVTDVARDLLGIDEKEFNKKFSKINQTSIYLVYDAINQTIKEEQQEVHDNNHFYRSPII